MTFNIIEDSLEIDSNGNIIGWACLTNSLSLSIEKIGECPAHKPPTSPVPDGEVVCPRGFTEKFECRRYGVDS